MIQKIKRVHSRIVLVVSILGILCFLPRCKSWNRKTKVASDETLNMFSEMERESSKYGTISVGAPRVINYDNPVLKEERNTLIRNLETIKNKIMQKPLELKPEGFNLVLSKQENKIDIEFRIGTDKPVVPDKEKKEPSKKGDQGITSEEFEGISKIVQQITKDKASEPNKIGLIGLRLAELKYIDSELEDLKLGSAISVNEGFRRVVVNLDLTAWVRDKARAALVFVDLYPYNADGWCHEAKKFIEKFVENDSNPINEWEDLLKSLNAFKPGLVPNDVTDLLKKAKIIVEKEKSKGLRDSVAFCHSWLKENNLLPCLKHVERLGVAEYLILGGGDYYSSKYSMGIGIPLGSLGSVGIRGIHGSNEQKEQIMANIRPLNLAFVAGEQRAGWLFMPSIKEGGKMPPTARRIKMVVDIPIKLSKLGIHVHKLFLGQDLGILPEADFATQTANLNQTGWILPEAEEGYEKYFLEATAEKAAKEPSKYYPSPVNWRLVKSRMRNLLYQGWSEEIVVNIPEP